MPAHSHYGKTSPVRYYAAEGEFYMRCEDCSKPGGSGNHFWPLTLEFWDPRNLQRCRACEKTRRTRAQRELRAKDPEWTAEQHRIYLRTNRRVLNLKRNHRRAQARLAATQPALGAPA